MNVPRLKQSKLHEALSYIDNEFSKPKILLEQYPTDAKTTSELLHRVQSLYGDIEGRMVADLGCGVGVLTIGAALLGADYVLGIDIDQDALDVCQENVEIFDKEFQTIDLLQFDVTRLLSNSICDENVDGDEPSNSNRHRFYKCFDTVIMNPPFGTKHEGIDMKFVETALTMSRNSVYSFHKTSTRSFIEKKAEEWNVECSVEGQVRFLVKNMYKCHKSKSVDIEVDFIRFFHSN